MLEFVLALSLIGDQSVDPAAVTREVTELVQQLGTAWKNGDCEAWGRIVAPEWSVIHINGEVITRAEALKMCGAPAAPLETMASDQLSVRSFGDTAVVTGRTTATPRGANAETVTLRFTDVFVRRNGRWQVVASQATRLTAAQVPGR
jgi:uncharacterized protein (TIGR02246 family)